MLNLFILAQRIEQLIHEARIPGLALAIVRGDEVVYARGFGVTSVEDAGLPVTPQTLFAIGSISKVLTGTVIMRFVEAGILDLDRPIAHYVPWITFRRPGAEQRITLRMLLSHTSGLRTRHERSEPRLPRDPAGLETFIRNKLPRLACIAEPGTVFVYSNAGLSLAGYILETIAGKHFPDVICEQVFDPLEMRRTTYDRSVAMTYPLALPHTVGADGVLQVTHFYQTNTPGNPAGFAISTALDLANLAIMYLGGGRFRGEQILAPELIAQMHTLHADIRSTPGRGYGLTFWLDPYKDIMRVNHGGAIMTFRGYLELIPTAKVGLVLLASRLDFGSPALDKLIEQILDQLLDLAPSATTAQLIAPEPSNWRSYVGQYWSYLDGAAAIAIVDSQLRLDWNGWQAALLPLDTDRYAIQDTNLTAGFVCGADGMATHLLIGLPAWSMTFERAAEVLNDPSGWGVFVGEYMLDDQLVDYKEKLTVRLADGRLYFNIDTEEDEEVVGVQVGDSAFATKYGLFEFRRADSGEVQSVVFADEFIYRRSQVAGRTATNSSDLQE
jgi:CubicO group peptidase (beta-lactamase class C family)